MARWSAWEARQTRQTLRCPECGTALIDGVGACIECDHEFERLVQNPGDGDWMVRIISELHQYRLDNPYASPPQLSHSLKSDNPEVYDLRGTLGERQFDGLMEFLGRYQDTAPFADGRWEYFFPPYVLLSGLRRDEADDIVARLDEFDIDSDARRNPGTLSIDHRFWRRSQPGGHGVRRRRPAWHRRVYGPGAPSTGWPSTAEAICTAWGSSSLN